MKLLITLPCLNEGAQIASVVGNIPRTFAGVDRVQVLVVDDGSTDDTAARAREAGAKVVSHKRNLGLGDAFRTAVQYTIDYGYDLMVNMDGDSQFHPADIEKLIEPILRQEADFVTGNRFYAGRDIENMPWVKRWGNKQMTRLVNWVCRQKFSDVSCGFRAYSRDTLLKLNVRGTHTYTQESFVSMVFHRLTIVEVPVAVTYYKERKSRVAGKLGTYIRRALSIIANVMRDYYPMRFFGWLGNLFMAPTLVFGILFFAHYIRAGYFSGYLFAGLISAFCFLIAVLMYIFGMALESIVRLHRNEEELLYLQRKSMQTKSDD